VLIAELLNLICSRPVFSGSGSALHPAQYSAVLAAREIYCLTRANRSRNRGIMRPCWNCSLQIQPAEHTPIELLLRRASSRHRAITLGGIRMSGWQTETLGVLAAISGRRIVPPGEVVVESLQYAQLSYSMSGEDSFLGKHFKDRIRARQPGIYVDIGCGAIWDISNTFMFYCHGWRGLCVDPNPHAVPEWAEWRPRDKRVVGAIGEEEGPAFWHAHKANWGMARVTLDGNRPDTSWFAGVPTVVRRLDSLFAECLSGQDIQFMTIDVEGAELGVLRSNDWTRWRPEIIVMECVGFDFAAPLALAPVRYLTEQGYAMTSKLNDNLVFIRGAK